MWSRQSNAQATYNYQSNYDSEIANYTDKSYSTNNYIDDNYYESKNEIQEYQNPIPVIEEGQWGIQHAIFSDSFDKTANNKPSVPTVCEYDNYLELLWVGQSSGRVACYSYSTDNVNEYLKRVVSFRSQTKAIVEIMSLKDKVVVLGQRKAKVHSKGGLSHDNLNIEDLTRTGVEDISFTCGCLINPRAGGLITADSLEPSHILLGTTSNIMYSFDLNALSPSKSTQFDVICSPTAVTHNHNFTVVGCTDGKIRVIDSRLKSNKVVTVIDAHTGPISDLSLRDITVSSCGFLDRVVSNQSIHSSSTTSQNVPDPMVRLFDLRMAKASSTITMTLSTARYVKFVPASSHVQPSDQPNILMASSSGVLQINALTKIQQVVTIPMQNKKETIGAIAVASSGNLLVAASSSGYLIQYALTLSPGFFNTVNERVSHMYIPPQVTKPVVSIPLGTPSVASAYILRPNPQDEEPLASSFQTTPNLLNRKYQVHPQRIVSKALLSKAVKRDFIYTVPNPGYPANSLVFSPNDVYEVSDPRLIDPNNENEGLVETIYDYSSESDSSIPISYRRIESNLSHHSKQRKLGAVFDYNKFNETNMIGLENKCPSSYTNSMLQFLFHLTDIRSYALNAQIQPIYYNNQQSLWCELGFLFHMIITKSQNVRGLNSYPMSNKIFEVYTDNDKVVIPGNFQRTFQQLPEAAALGLLDDSHNDQSLQIINFSKFIFQSLHKEFDKSAIPLESYLNDISPIESLFGFNVATVNTFFPSNVVDRQPLQSLLSLDFHCSNINRGKQINSDATFAMCLWHSLRKESTFRAYCASSNSYERCTQVRSVLSVPKILTLLSNDYIKDFCVSDVDDKQNKQWIPTSIEICILTNEEDSFDLLVVSCKYEPIDDDNTTKWFIYDGNAELQSLYSASKSANYRTSISFKDENWQIHELSLLTVISMVKNTRETHSVAQLLIDEEKNYENDNTSTEKHWYIFNDFSITKTSLLDVTSIKSFRVPVFIAFVNNGSDVNLTSCESVFSLESYKIPSSVLYLPSLSKVLCIHPDTLPEKGDLVALDAEFVSVELGSSIISPDGQRIMNTDGRQVLARLSIIDGTRSIENPLVLVDDYILPGEPIVDYVTKFSGISEEDLSPMTSQHALITRRSSYLKLRYFIDNGVIFIGHGLKKDFDTANVVIPCNQVRDTVELWRLPNQRKISLKFLASYLLQETIQDEIHDSIEDAKTSLQLYRHYEKLVAKDRGHFETTLKEIYAYGLKSNWTIGIEKLQPYK